MVAAQAIDRRPGPPTFAVGRFAYRLVVALVFAFMLMPVVFVAWVSFFANEIVTFPPQGYTLSWYTRAWANRAFTDGFLTSIQVGLFSMVAGLILGIPASFAIVRGRFPGREALNALMLSPLVVPGVVAGTAIYIYFVQLEIWTDVRFVATLPGLVAAHVMLTIPWTVRLISASLVGVDRSIEEAAMNLGATPLTTFLRITLPMIRPGVVAAAIFSFIASFTDLEMTLFLIGPGRSTLQIALLQYLEWKFDPSVAAVSFVQVTIIGIGLLVTDRFVKLSKVV
ncbi:MAG TPA: ABC transporter permease [Microvirga sp.]|jgi:putative spermidine/putrescine transport system permease protein|nr:ABC transporter permease [Microvirga sp.]